MKYLKIAIPFVVLTFVSYALVRAAPFSSQNAPKCAQISVTSATTPTAIVTPSSITTYDLHVESGSATGVYMFYYSGALPTAVPTPSPVMELTVGTYFPDAVACATQNCLNGMGQGIAAVLFTGSTAVKVDACQR